MPEAPAPPPQVMYVPVPAPSMYPALRPVPPRRVNVAAAVGAGLAGLAPFLPWVHVVLFGDLNLFTMYNVAGKPPVLAYGALLVAGIVLVFALTGSSTGKVITLILSIGSAIIGSLFVFVEIRDVEQAGGLASVGVGPFVAAAGVITMFIGALTWKT